MSNTPTLIAYSVKQNGKNRKSFWTRIGAAWPQKNGQGFNVQLEAFPVDGKIVLMPPKADDASATFEGELDQ